MFGNKEKPAKLQAERRCPFLITAGTSANGCIRDKCAIWQDSAGACAINVIAAGKTVLPQ